MKRLFLICGFVLGLWGIVQAQDALEIVKKSDEKARGKTNYAEATMTIVRPTYKRSISMKSWSKGVDYSLVYITSPAREKGQVFLKRQRDMWNWVPAIERLIKLPPSMMMQSWMGSDFTNDDLVKQSSIVVDYDHKLVGEEKVREFDCYKVELVPKPEAPVVWGKIVLWISKDGNDQIKGLFYDEDEELVHTMNAYDVKDFGDRTLPSRMEIVPIDEEGHKTVMVFHKSVFDKPMEDRFFSIQNMKRVR